MCYFRTDIRGASRGLPPRGDLTRCQGHDVRVYLHPALERYLQIVVGMTHPLWWYIRQSRSLILSHGETKMDGNETGCKSAISQWYLCQPVTVCEGMDDEPVDIIFRPVTSSFVLLKVSIMLHAVDPYASNPVGDLRESTQNVTLSTPTRRNLKSM